MEETWNIKRWTGDTFGELEKPKLLLKPVP